jgi:hypothetical protein
MRETAEDVAQLQRLLDDSAAAAGEHLRTIFQSEARPFAQELLTELDAVFEFHVGVLTGAGAPLVAPLDGIFFRGRIWFGFPGGSLRAGLIRKDPRISASYQKGESFAFIVHGQAVEVREDAPEFQDYFDCVQALYTNLYGPKWVDWYRERKREGEFNGYIEARRLFAKR